MPLNYDVIGIGNAIVDVLVETDESFLAAHALEKGAMTLVEGERSAELYEAMPPGLEMSGGSAANTMAGFASLGGRGAYIGKVRDDQLGEVFRHDIRAAGVAFSTAPLTAGPATARCLIFVTPDAQRTMQTFLGASVELTAADVPEELIASGQITYLEGYLWDRPTAKAAFIRASELAHAAGRQVALTLSDSFCVERHRASFLDLVSDHIDVLFANEREITSLYETDDFDAALRRARDCFATVALTRSEHGAEVVRGGEVCVIPAAPVQRGMDTTGAAHVFAAGVLFGCL